MYGSGTCNNLTSGNKTDFMINEVLGAMTNEIDTQDDVYNSSYWCYHFRIKETGIIKFTCENFACPNLTYEYRCCKYKIDFVNKRRSNVCNLEHYHPGSVWWALAIFLGYLCWVCYPLLLVHIYMLQTYKCQQIHTSRQFRNG